MNEWYKDAKCKGLSVDLFFPLRKIPESTKRVCRECPVQEQCLEWALRHEEYGYRGGMTEGQRRIERKVRGIKFQPLHTPNYGEEYVHGTTRAYDWERREGIPHCDACRMAHNEQNQRTYRRKAIRLSGQDIPPATSPVGRR